MKFIKTLERFTEEKYPFVTIWKIRDTRSLFNLKDKVSHVSSVVYEAKCNCVENYIDETGRNVTITWDEYSDIGKDLEPSKHLNEYPEHRFNWKILKRAPNKIRQRKVHEGYYVM